MRTILHRTCLLNGQHPPGSDLARECPIPTAEKRSARARKAASTRRTWQEQARGAPTAAPDGSGPGSPAPGPSQAQP